VNSWSAPQFPSLSTRANTSSREQPANSTVSDRSSHFFLYRHRSQNLLVDYDLPEIFDPLSGQTPVAGGIPDFS
jgi:hypothetical protein